MSKFSTGLRRSSPTILTVLGIVGVVGTAVTAVRATPKAMRLIKAKKDELETDKTYACGTGANNLEMLYSVRFGRRWYCCLYNRYWCNG